MPLFLFALVPLCSAALILLAAGLGGMWAYMAVLYMTVLVFAMDRLLPLAIKNPDPEQEFPLAPPLLALLGVTHFVLLATLLYSFGHGHLSFTETALVAFSAGLFFGQVTHPTAHELIHQSSRPLRLMGQLAYSSILFGHHASAHLRVHHVHVATPKDPNSPTLGESYYSYAPRAWIGSFREGLNAEKRLRGGQATPAWRTPYGFYLMTSALTLLGVCMMAGAYGVCLLIVMSVHSHMQILLSDYVQHYGLRRQETSSGRYTPVGPEHSWNAPQRFSAALMVNAPRHSDHHITPSRPYPALQLNQDTMPTLPRSLPVMGAIALVPPLWRRMMDARAVKWQKNP